MGCQARFRLLSVVTKTWHFCLTISQLSIKVCKYMKMWDKKLIISSAFGYVSNILTPPPVMSVGKRDGSCHGISLKCARYRGSTGAP